MFSPMQINTQFETLGLFITRTLFVLLSYHSDCKKAGTFSCISMIKLFSSTILIVANIDFLKTNIINEQLYCIRQCKLCVRQTGKRNPEQADAPHQENSWSEQCVFTIHFVFLI